MRHASQKKIVSEHKRVVFKWHLSAALILIILISLSVQVFERLERYEHFPSRKITLDNRSLTAEIADEDDERSKGLSGRNSLPAGRALILSYKVPGPGAIWMKDMKFSIDVLWVKADGTVVGIAKNIAPNTYPRSFYSSIPITSVVELPAGYVDSYNIKNGSTLRLE